MEYERDGGNGGETVPTGATLSPDAKVDPEATRRFSERFVDQARDHMGSSDHRDEEDD